MKSLAVALTVVLIFVAGRISVAGWVPGYQAPSFSGGAPTCAVEFGEFLAIGGEFTGAGCVESFGLVFFDGDDFRPTTAERSRRLNSIDSINEPGRVNAVVVHEGSVVVGGRFEVGDSGPLNVARWDGSRWRALEGTAGPDELRGGAVRSLVVFDGDLIAGGTFTADGQGNALPGMARWDGQGWTAMPVPPSGSRTLSVIDGELFGGLSKWDGTGWRPLAEWTGTPRVTTIDKVNDGIAFGGLFDTIDGQPILGAALLRPDGSFEQFGSPLERYYFSHPFVETETVAARSFASIGDATYVLAPLGDYSTYPEYTLAELRNGSWTGVPDVLSGQVYGQADGAFVEFRGDLIALLHTDLRADVDGQAGVDLLRFDGSSWSALAPGRGSTPEPSAVGIAHGHPWYWTDGLGAFAGNDVGTQRVLSAGTYRVGSIASHGNKIAVVGERIGGVDEPIDALVRTYEVAIDGSITAMSDLAPFGYARIDETTKFSHIVPYGDGYLVAVSVGSSAQQAAGTYLMTTPILFFGSIANVALPGLGPISGQIDALTVHQGQPWYAVGGEVYRVDGTPETTMSATLVGTFDERVHALVSDGSRLVAGGVFDSVNALSAPRLAAYAAGGWQPLPTVDGIVNALSFDGRFVVIGGDFQSIGGTPSLNVAILRDDLIGPFPDGPDGPVTSIAAEPDRIVAAGTFTSAGGECAVGLAVWDAPLTSLSIDEPEKPNDEPTLSTRLLPPAPNPFNARVQITYALGRPGQATLRVIDPAGRLVRTLVAGRLDAGAGVADWDGRDDGGRRVASGVYFATLDVDGRRIHRKLALVE